MKNANLRIWKLLQLVGSLLFLAAAVSGCGLTPQPSEVSLENQEAALTSSLSALAKQGAQSGIPTAPTSTSNNSQNSSNGWSCPQYANVSGAAGDFLVCANTTNNTQLLFSSAVGGSFCIFPKSYTSPQNMSPKCATVSANMPILLAYGSTRPQQVAVVTNLNAAQFIQYLSGTATSPAYSEGFVQ